MRAGQATSKQRQRGYNQCYVQQSTTEHQDDRQRSLLHLWPFLMGNRAARRDVILLLSPLASLRLLFDLRDRHCCVIQRRKGSSNSSNSSKGGRYACTKTQRFECFLKANSTGILLIPCTVQSTQCEKDQNDRELMRAYLRLSWPYRDLICTYPNSLAIRCIVTLLYLYFIQIVLQFVVTFARAKVNFRTCKSKLSHVRKLCESKLSQVQK